jgi:hypothetical protein
MPTVIIVEPLQGGNLLPVLRQIVYQIAITQRSAHQPNVATLKCGRQAVLNALGYRGFGQRWADKMEPKNCMPAQGDFVREEHR